jgi:hypothetical protein
MPRLRHQMDDSLTLSAMTGTPHLAVQAEGLRGGLHQHVQECPIISSLAMICVPGFVNQRRI